MTIVMEKAMPTLECLTSMIGEDPLTVVGPLRMIARLGGNLILGSYLDMSLRIAVDECNSVIDPALHDALIYRIDFGGKHVSVFFRDPGGQKFRLDATGVAHLHSSGLAEDNIVLTVSVEDGDDVRADLVNRILPGATDAQCAYRTKVLKSLAEKQLKLIQITPSYGGEIVILCEEVDYDFVS